MLQCLGLLVVCIAFVVSTPKATSNSYVYHHSSPHPSPYPKSYGAPQHVYHQQPRYGLYQPQFPSPVEQEPANVPQPEAVPQQNCTVEDEVLKAEICVPDFTNKCKPSESMTKRLEMGNFCYNVTRTECTQTETTAEVEICNLDFDAIQKKGKAKTVEVVFRQECETRLVTVCQDAINAGGGGTNQMCSDVEQETCYNVPSVEEVEVNVTMSFPQPSRDCKTMSVTIPEVKCEDIVEQKCQDIPRIVEAPDSFENCEVVVGEPKCEEIELVLPKQVCTDIVFGFAEVPSDPNQFELEAQDGFFPQYDQSQYNRQPTHYGAPQPRYGK